ncbi:MAG: polysaccharide polymerase hfsC [Pseudomonadota bacterium]
MSGASHFSKTTGLNHSNRSLLQQSKEPAPAPFQKSLAQIALDVAVILFFLLHLQVFVSLPVKFAGGPVPGLGFVWMFGSILSIGLALIKPVRTIGFAVAILPFVAICMWAYLSFTWSIDPIETLRGTTFMTCSLIGACAIAALLTWEQIIARVTIILGVLVIVSIGLAVGMPSIGQMHEAELAGSWSGVWVEKQAMGMYAALLILAVITNVLGNRKNWPSLVLIPIGVLAIIGTTGKTAVLMSMMGVAVLVTGWLVQREARIAIATLWSSLIIGSVTTYALTLGKDQIFRLLGKSPDFTGRTTVWREIEFVANKKPMTGYGFNTVWKDQKSLDGPYQWIANGTDFFPQNAHSSWLDTKLQLGMPGLILLVVAMGFAWLVTLIHLRRGGVGALFALSCLATFTLISFTESILVSKMDMPWMLVMLFTSKMAWEIFHPNEAQASVQPLVRPPPRTYYNEPFTYPAPPT